MKAVMPLALLGFLVVLSPAAWACDCPQPKPLSSAVRTEAPIIFEGQVVEILDRSLHITRITPSDSTGETRPLGREVIFQVTRAWAGVATRRISLYMDDTDCAFPFEAGHRYVVFAHGAAKGRPTTSVCMRTTAADHAEAVIKALGPAKHVRRSRA
ncbi:MAG TPA: hypothetical protein VFZ98_07200 [Vicinamibacterales bacterium]